MKGYWHFAALAAGAAFLTVLFQNNWLILVFLLWLCYLYFSGRLRKWPIFVSLTTFMFCSLYIPAIDKQAFHELPNETTHFSGTISGPVTKTKDRIEFVLDERNLNQKILIYYFANHADEEMDEQANLYDLNYGASCTITGIAELPDESRNPGQFDYRTYLLKKDIPYQLTVESLDQMECSGSDFLNRFYILRDNLLTHVKNTFSDFTASWLSAIVFGDDSSIDEETEEIFQRWSLSHIIAISGSNISLIVALFYFLLIKLNVLTKEKAAWLMVILLPVYALLAGGEPSVWRASIMVVCFIILNKLKLRFSFTDVLSIVFILLILFDKYMVYHIGFQLSFIVTFAILLSKQWIYETKSPFWQVLQISFVSQMVIIPIQLAYFSIFQPLSIIVNLIIVPYFTVFIIPLMYLLLLISFLPKFILSIFDSVFIYVHGLALSIIDWIDQTFFFPFLIGGLSVLTALIYYFLFFIFMNHLQQKRLRSSLHTGIAICFLLMLVGAKPYFSQTGVVTMLDIGQGDAFVIELPYRKGVIMIDAGSGFSFDDMEASDRIYKQIIRPFFYSRGIRGIDAIIMTHEDIDHIGSVSFILDEMEVDHLLVSNYFNSETLKGIMKGNSVPEIHSMERDDVFTIGDQVFHVLAPAEDRGSTNENSLVIHTELGGKNWLFTGDIGKNEETELIQTYPDLSIDILKVAHHGSNTSTDSNFLRAIAPEWALISVGKDNSYGHPGQEVIRALKEENLTILRTDNDGAVQYFYQREAGTFYKYLP